MGVYLKPCRGCPIPETGDERCHAKRDEMREKVSGLGLTSAAFKCGVLAEKFRPGTRITINTPVLKYGRYADDGYRVQWVEVKATILAFDGRRFQCVVDLDEMERAYQENESEESTSKEPKDFIYRKPMLASRVIRFLDEPPRSLCKGGNVAGDDGKCDRGSCFDCNPIDHGIFC